MTDSPYDDLVTEAFFYGFPIVFNLEQVERFLTTGIGALPASPLNSFGHATKLAGPADTFVSVNNDTVYSIAQVDAGGGPVRLDVPDSARPLLRPPVRRRLDQQLRLRRRPRDGHPARGPSCWCRPAGRARPRPARR